MRVLLPVSTYVPEGSEGGLASFFYELAIGLAAKGHEVVVSTLSATGDSDTMMNGVRVVRHAYDTSVFRHFHETPGVPMMAWSLPIAVTLYRKTMPLAETFKPDVLECVEYGFQGVFFALNRQYPLVIRSLCPQFHLMDLGYHGTFTALDKTLVAALECIAMTTAEKITGPSHSITKVVSEHTSIPPSDIEIIKNPLTFPEYVEATPYEPQSAFPKIVYVGRIEKLKGCDLIVEALPEIVSKYPNAHVTFVGADTVVIGDTSGKTFTEQLKARLEELGLSRHATFKGKVPRADLQAIVRGADLGTFPTRYDCSPYACFETMSYGCPVVAASSGGVPEYIEDGVTGLLIEPENAKALADGVIRLAGDDQLRKRLGPAGQETIRRQCNVDDIIPHTITLYEQAIEKFRSQNQPNNLRWMERAFEAFDEYCKYSYAQDQINAIWSAASAAGEKAGFAAGRNSLFDRKLMMQSLMKRLGKETVLN